MAVPQFELFDVSFPEKLLKIVATRGEIFSLKFAKYRLAAGLRPDPLGELKRSPVPLAAIRGPTSKGAKEGMEGKGKEEGRKGEGRGRKGMGGKGWGERRGQEWVHNLRKTTPRHQMAGFGSGLQRYARRRARTGTQCKCGITPVLYLRLMSLVVPRHACQNSFFEFYCTHCFVALSTTVQHVIIIIIVVVVVVVVVVVIIIMQTAFTLHYAS